MSVSSLVPRQPCNIVKYIMYYIMYCLHNQAGRIGYEEIHCDTFRGRAKSSWRACIQEQAKSQKILDALILLVCDEDGYQIKRSTNEEIARVLQISMRKIDRVKKRFVEEGFDVALNRRKGSRIYAKKTDGEFEAHLVA